jgi:hypothetical protein
MNNKMVNGVVGGAVVEVDRRESESKGCDVFYPFGLAPPGVYTYVLWCVDRGRHTVVLAASRGTASTNSEPTIFFTVLSSEVSARDKTDQPSSYTIFRHFFSYCLFKIGLLLFENFTIIII